MNEIVIYQMGKVASISLRNKLKKCGFSVFHAHWLDRNSLVGTLKNVLDETRDNSFEEDLSPLLNNIQAMQRILWHKKHRQQIMVITLARHPIEWYRSHFVQNMNKYIDHVAAHANRSSATDVTQNDIFAFISNVFEQLELLDADIDDRKFHSALTSNIFEDTAVKHHLLMIARPILWFDHFFKPVFDIDILDGAFDKNAGYRIYENHYSKTMLIQYESLNRTYEPLARFLGLKNFSLSMNNVSARKPYAAEVRQAFDHLNLSQAMRHKVFSTRYCRFFGFESAP